MTDERIVVPVEPGAAEMRVRFEADYKDALRQGDRTAVGTLRLLRAAVQEVAVGRTDRKRRDFGQPISEADVTSIVEKQIKQRAEAAEAFKKGGREERAAEEAAEAVFLRRYLPEKMTRAEIVAAIQPLVAEHGTDFRKVMPVAARELKGKADGRVVQEVVRELTA